MTVTNPNKDCVLMSLKCQYIAQCFVRSLVRLGLTGVKVWPKSIGQPGDRLNFDQGGQGIKDWGSRGYPGQ